MNTKIEHSKFLELIDIIENMLDTMDKEEILELIEDTIEKIEIFK